MYRRSKSGWARVFGIAYFAEAWASPQAVENLEQNAWTLIEGRSFKSFRIDARRADKSFPHTSVEINQRVGAYVKERSRGSCGSRKRGTDLLDRNRRKVCADLRRAVSGPGGLPVGTSGKVVVLLSGGIDSPVAAWKMIKRGCTPVFVHFHSFPYTNKESQEKAKQIGPAACRNYALRSKIYLVPFAEVQRHIMVDTPLDTRVILYRRYMMRLAEQIARREKARVLVTGDSVGQVASQTIENIDVISRAVSMPILRPLIGDDKIEIIDSRAANRNLRYLDSAGSGLLFSVRAETSGNESESHRNREVREPPGRRVDVMRAVASDSAEVLLEYPSYATREVRQL